MFARLRSNHSSHRTRILTVLLASGLPVLSVAIFALGQYLDIAKQNVVDDRIAMAQSGALTALAFVTSTTASAQTLALSPTVTDSSRRFALPALLNRVRLANPTWDLVALVDKTGRSLVDSGAPVVDDTAVQLLVRRVLGSNRPDMSASTVSLPRGPVRLLIGVPLTFDDGGLGVLLVSPSLHILEAELRAQARGPQINVAVHDADGIVLIGPSVAWQAPSHADTPGGSNQVSIGGVPAIVSFAPVPDVGWQVLVAQPSEVAFAAFYREVTLGIVALVVAFGLASLLGWVLGGRLSVYYDRLVAARDVAEKATRTRDALVASVSHDLQNPITAAKGNVQLLKLRAARDPDQPAGCLLDGLSRTEQAVTHMQAMVEELVDVAQLEAGHGLALHSGPTDLLDLVRQIVDEQSLAVGRHRVIVDSNSPAVWVTCDSSRMGRVIGNLLSNAVKYSPDDSSIGIALSRGNDTDARVTLSVSDHGVGIPAADLPRIFERFHRGLNVPGYAGTGLGLAGARSIVEQHGGSVELESQEGVGTTVSVRLPRLAVAPAPTPPSVPVWLSPMSFRRRQPTGEAVPLAPLASAWVSRFVDRDSTTGSAPWTPGST